MESCEFCKYWDQSDYELNPNLDAIWFGWCSRRKKKTWEDGSCGYFRPKPAPSAEERSN